MFATELFMHVTFFDHENHIWTTYSSQSDSQWKVLLDSIAEISQSNQGQTSESTAAEGWFNFTSRKAAPHRCKMLLEAVCSWGWVILLHPTYSQDLSPCDCFLFQRSRIAWSHRLSTEEELNVASKLVSLDFHGDEDQFPRQNPWIRASLSDV